MSKNTPGPWLAIVGNAKRDFDEIEIRCTEPNKDQPLTIARVIGPNTEAGKANAHLIASAPELLDALIGAYALAIGWAGHYKFNQGLSDFHPLHRQIIQKAQEAITKAKGVDHE